MRSRHRPVLALSAVGILVHTAVLLVAHWKTGTIDGYAFRSLDCGEYYTIARNLVDHGAFSQSAEPPFLPDTWRTPGYPLFLATVMLLFGKSPLTLVFVQQVLSVLNVLLVFRVARGWMSDSRAAVAALLFLLEPYHLFYSLWLLSTTWLVTLILLTWVTWSTAIPSRLRTSRSGELRRFALLGGLCGFLVLTWPGAILVPVAVFAGIGNEVRSSKFKVQRRIGRNATFCSSIFELRTLNFRSLSFIVVCFCVIGSWMIRNVQVAGRFALSHQSGIVLAYFKATEIVLWQAGRTADRYLETSLSGDRRDQPHPAWEAIDQRLQARFPDLPAERRADLTWPNLAQGNRPEVESFRISSELASIAAEHLIEAPWSTLACCLARCGSILTFPLDLALWPPNGVEVNRLRSAALGALYLLLSVAVAVGLARRRIGFEAGYFPLACTMALLLATTPQTDPRFRVPMIPLLIVVALLPGRRATREDRAPDHPASTTGEPDTQEGPC